jgi:hypothetical protein
MLYSVKFFGSMEERMQIKQVKTIVDAPSRDRVEVALKRMGYKVINGLKIREYNEKNC